MDQGYLKRIAGCRDTMEGLIYAFGKIAQVHTQLETGRTVGKVVVVLR